MKPNQSHNNYKNTYTHSYTGIISVIVHLSSILVDFTILLPQLTISISPKSMSILC